MLNLARYLAELGFAPDSTPSLSEIKKRWIDLCKKCHPDTGGDPEQFKRVTHCYKVLTDASYRHKESEREVREGNRNAKGDLNIRIICPVRFEDAFFGRRVMISFNSLEFNPDFSVKPLIGEGALYLKNIVLQLAPGSTAGSEHAFSGQGHRSGDSAGDCLVSVAPESHPRFSVAGQDVASKERVPLELLLKGGRFEVLTMYGPRWAKIRPGTMPGAEIRIAGCGVARRGDHVFSVEPVFPDEAELRTDSWSGLGISWEAEEDVSDEAFVLNLLFDKLRG